MSLSEALSFICLGHFPTRTVWFSVYISARALGFYFCDANHLVQVFACFFCCFFCHGIGHLVGANYFISLSMNSKNSSLYSLN